MKLSNKPISYCTGYDVKVEEIARMGLEAARDKLNLDYPPGEKYRGSIYGYYYMQGEADALSDRIKV